jgi:undecaprenyl-diphosphatase
MVRTFINNLDKLDRFVCIRIFRFNGKKYIDRTMFWASRFGDGYVYGFVGLMVMIFNFSNTRSFITTGSLAFFIEHTLQKLLKRKTKRIRPCNILPGIKNLISLPDEFSFPSGHAAGAFLMATILRHFYPQFTIPFYLGASTISFSRIYNGVHYPSDVMAGLFLGIVSARLGLWIL